MRKERVNPLEGLSVAVFEKGTYARDIAQRLSDGEKMQADIYPTWIPGFIRALVNPDNIDIIVVHIPLTFSMPVIKYAIDELTEAINNGVNVVLLESEMLIDEIKYLSKKASNVGASIVSKELMYDDLKTFLDNLVGAIEEFYPE